MEKAQSARFAFGAEIDFISDKIGLFQKEIYRDSAIGAFSLTDFKEAQLDVRVSKRVHAGKFNSKSVKSGQPRKQR